MQSATKIGIVTGVVSSLLVLYFLDPLIRLIGGKAYFILGWINSGFWNSLYEKAALGVPKDPALMIFALSAGVAVGIAVGILTAISRNAKGPRAEAENSSISDSVPRKYFLRLPMDYFSSSNPLAVGMILAFYTSTIWMCFSIFYSLWSYLLLYKIVTSFDQHLKIITPYVREIERSKIVSDFSQMDSEEDYLKVYEELKRVAEENKLKLPENPNYSLWSL